MNNTNWADLFFNLDVNQMAVVFTDVLMNIFATHIPNKIVNDKDAPWMTPEIKTAIRRNSRVYRKWVNPGRIEIDRDRVREIQNITTKLIIKAKKTYFENLGKKLSDTNTGEKSFRTAYRRIVNKKTNTYIPPIFDDNISIPNFRHKANVFNCRPM